MYIYSEYLRYFFANAPFVLIFKYIKMYVLESKYNISLKAQYYYSTSDIALCIVQSKVLTVHENL